MDFDCYTESGRGFVEFVLMADLVVFVVLAYLAARSFCMLPDLIHNKRGILRGWYSRLALEIVRLAAVSYYFLREGCHRNLHLAELLVHLVADPFV